MGEGPAHELGRERLPVGPEADVVHGEQRDGLGDAVGSLERERVESGQDVEAAGQPLRERLLSDLNSMRISRTFPRAPVQYGFASSST